MSLFSIPGSTLRLLHITLHFIITSPWAPILYKFIKQLTHGREVSWKDIGTNIAPNPCITFIKSWSYKKSLWEGCDFLDWVTLSCSLDFFEILQESSFMGVALRQCLSPECVVWMAGSVVPVSVPKDSRESHGMFTTSNYRRPNNKGWARAENDSLIAVPDSC